MIPETELLDTGSAYYQGLMDWHQERYGRASLHRDRAIWAALVLGAVVVMQALTLAALMPLKQVALRVVEVDRVTGETHISQPLRDGSITQREALQKYWLNQYVVARLTYDYQDTVAHHTRVRQQSSRPVFETYHASMTDDADSPYARYGEHTRVSVRVKSIAFLDDNTASVRVTLTEESQHQQRTRAPLPYVATVRFTFTLEPTQEGDRLVNPLGFQVTRWRLDGEVPEEDRP